MAAVWLIYNVLDTELYSSILCSEGGRNEVFKMSGHDMANQFPSWSVICSICYDLPLSPDPLLSAYTPGSASGCIGSHKQGQLA